MTTSGTDADVIDALVGITPGSSLDGIRERRPEARAHAQATYRALFAPKEPGNVTAQERFTVGGFVAGLHGATAIAGAYAARLAPSTLNVACHTRSTKPGLAGYKRSAPPGSGRPAQASRKMFRLSTSRAARSALL